MAGKKNHTFLKFILLVLFVAIVGMGAWLGLSAKRVSDLYGEALETYQQMETHANQQDYGQALVDARTAATLTSQASEELGGIQWDIASYVPVLGSDVTTLRSIGSISGSLANDAVIPVLDAWDELSGSGVVVDGQLDIAQIQAKAGQFVQLAQTIKDAGEVVDTCKAQADALPASHFEALDGWTGSLRTTIDEADGLVDGLENVAGVIVNLSSTLSSLTGA